jgi:glycosyltransferase involved in cell wall biosynthesis
MKLVYRFSGPITNKVIHSQVAGSLGALARQGIEVDLLAWCGAGHALKHRAAYFRAQHELSELVGGSVRWKLTMDRLTWLDALRKRSELAGSTSGSNCVIQTRSQDMGLLMAELRAGRPELRFVYEVRGDALAELSYQLEAGPEREQRLKRARASLATLLPLADLVTCVSEVLADRMAAEYHLPQDRLLVVPCTADETRFRLNPEARAARRRELGLPPDAHLVVYSGSLVKGWDQPQAVRVFLGRELERNPFLHVLLISPDREVAEAMLAEFPAGRAHHRSLAHIDMQDWLVAADSALLMREPHPLNEVASPTKAAELLLCGVPLLLSSGIGDYSGWVEAAGTGRLLDETEAPAGTWRELGRLRAEDVRSAALPRVGRKPHAEVLSRRLRALHSS